MKLPLIIRKIKGRLIWISFRIESYLSDYWFDCFWGVETRRKLDRYDLDVEDKDLKVHAWSYEPCSYPRFKRVMKLLTVAPANLTFVDLGSGKGKQLMAAILNGFPKAIGVEFSPALHKAAQRNMEIFTRRVNSSTNAILENKDATQFIIPEEACLLCLFNPFQEPVVRKFVASMTAQTASRTESVYILYVHPTARIVFDESPMFEMIGTMPWPTDAVLYRVLL